MTRADMEFSVDRSSAAQVERHLRACDKQFVPPLGDRVDIAAYALKLVRHATRFEAWHEGTLVGLVATYFDDRQHRGAHVSNVSVLPGWASRGLARALLAKCIEQGRRVGARTIGLEVSVDNEAARRLYVSAGFQPVDSRGRNLAMCLRLQAEQHDDSAT